ncbi:unnamed protein product [Peniophora sp. CBMAI 1063]|nr:unnamed protein product [Peniophora sp. CBMAI 1063]
MADPATVRLNNYFQAQGTVTQLSCELRETPSNAAGRWTVTYKFNNNPLGSATAGRLGDAKEHAASVALRALGLF